MAKTRSQKQATETEIQGTESRSPAPAPAHAPAHAHKRSKRDSKGIRDIRKAISQNKTLLMRAMDSMEETRIKEFMSRCAPNADELTPDMLSDYSQRHRSDPINCATENVLATVPIDVAAEKRDYLMSVNYAYSHAPHRYPHATSQYYTGRCWLFAALNTMRHHLIANLDLDSQFSLSAPYLFFYDKIERSLFFISKMIELRDRPIHDIVVSGMLGTNLQGDGGTWQFFCNLILKYGIVPTSVYGECFNSTDSDQMNEVLRNKLSIYANEIRTSGKSTSELQQLANETYMPEIYSLMVKFMGAPPDRFDWVYHQAGTSFDNQQERGEYISVKGLTPMSFYDTFLRDDFSLENKVVLRHDPRETSEYYRVYSTEHFGSMVGGKGDTSLNVPFHVLSDTAARQVMAGAPVWFSADVGKSLNYEYGLLATEAFDYESVLNTKLDLSKAASLDMRLSSPSHAMVLVGLDMGADCVNKWKVENSWGERNGGDPGYLQMTQEWFGKYGYEVVVDLDSLDDASRQAYDQYKYSPIVLPYNDAFGAVA